MLARFRKVRGALAFAFVLLITSLSLSGPVEAQTTATTNSGAATSSSSSGGFLSSLTDMFSRPTLAESLNQYQNSFANVKCWSCQIFTSFGDTVFVNGKSVASQADGPLSGVLVAFGSLFALFYLGSAFVSGDASDLLARWKTFWKLCIAVACGSAVLAANSFTWVWQYVYGPLAAVPLAVANAFGGGVSGSCDPAATVTGAPAGAAAMTAKMGAIVCGGHTISMQGLGTAMALAFAGDGFVGTFINIIIAVILGVIFVWIAVTFPLVFIDCLLRLMVVGIIAPILVVCAVFKPTRSLVKMGITNVIYAANTFAFTSIMFSLGSTFFNGLVTAQMNQAGQLNSTDLFGRAVSLIGGGFVFAAMIRMVPTLAAEFSQFSGGSGGVGEAVEGKMRGTAQLATQGATGVTRGTAGYVWNNSRFGEAGRMTGAVQKGMGGAVADALGKGVT